MKSMVLGRVVQKSLGYTVQTDAKESILRSSSLRGNFGDTLTGSSQASVMII